MKKKLTTVKISDDVCHPHIHASITDNLSMVYSKPADVQKFQAPN